MAGSTRIQGDALAFIVGGTDYWQDITSVSLVNDDADSSTVTYADVAAGGAKQFTLKGSAIQSTQAGSLWSYQWNNTGTSVAFRYSPNGNATASADQPHIVGTATVGARPTIGGDAGTDDFTFDWEMKVTGTPTLDYGTSAQASITSISPAGRTGGQVVSIYGLRFTGATAVTFGSNAATSIYVVSDSVISAVIPTGSGVKAVTVTTPAGTSASVNYTVS